MKKIHLSVVIPCYNEKENLKRGVLDQVENYLARQKYSSEVIVSDDESTDGSLELVTRYLRKHARFRLLKNKHGGKPFALRSGIRSAKGRIVLTTDMDQSTPIDQASKLLPYFSEGCQVVIGSRGESREGFSAVRRLGSMIFRVLRQRLLVGKITDTQCGFKAYENEVARDLFSRLTIFKDVAKSKGWRVSAFDVELLFVAQKCGYRIMEVPVQWKDRDVSQSKKRKYFKESKEMLKEILRVKLNDLRGRYD